jgi:single-strand DNA-binding protein
LPKLAKFSFCAESSDLKTNVMVLIGRLTKDAVVTQLKDERKVVNFTLVVNDYYKPKNSDKGVTVTTYVN